MRGRTNALRNGLAMKLLSIVSAWFLLAVFNSARADEPAVVKAAGVVEARTLVDVNPSMAGMLLRLGTEPDDPSKDITYLSHVKEGTILVYIIKRFHSRLMIIHLLPNSGVQFVTWEPT